MHDWLWRDLGFFVPSYLVEERRVGVGDGCGLSVARRDGARTSLLLWATTAGALRVVAVAEVRWNHPARRLATVERVGWPASVPEEQVAATVRALFLEPVPVPAKDPGPVVPAAPLVPPTLPATGLSPA